MPESKKDMAETNEAELESPEVVAHSEEEGEETPWCIGFSVGAE